MIFFITTRVFFCWTNCFILESYSTVLAKLAYKYTQVDIQMNLTILNLKVVI